MIHSGSPYQSDDIPDLADVTGLHKPHHTPEQADTLATLAAELGMTPEREAAAARWASHDRTADLYALTTTEAARAIEAMRKQVKP